MSQLAVQCPDQEEVEMTETKGSQTMDRNFQLKRNILKLKVLYFYLAGVKLHIWEGD